MVNTTSNTQHVKQVEFRAFDDVVESVKTQKKEKTSHIAIHTLHTDGLRELYRHFLVMPDGAILEVRHYYIKHGYQP